MWSTKFTWEESFQDICLPPATLKGGQPLTVSVWNTTWTWYVDTPHIETEYTGTAWSKDTWRVDMAASITNNICRGLVYTCNPTHVMVWIQAKKRQMKTHIPELCMYTQQVYLEWFISLLFWFQEENNCQAKIDQLFFKCTSHADSLWPWAKVRARKSLQNQDSPCTRSTCFSCLS